VTPGLDAVAQTLRAARRLANVVRADLVIAVVYNAIAVALCIAGLMKPWLAALLMPASSLGTIAFTVVRLSRKERS
jgi:Cu2+-exporting ATPase